MATTVPGRKPEPGIESNGRGRGGRRPMTPAADRADSLGRQGIPVCQSGLVSMWLPPHWLRRSRRPVSGTPIVSGRPSRGVTLISAPRRYSSCRGGAGLELGECVGRAPNQAVALVVDGVLTAD